MEPSVSWIVLDASGRNNEYRRVRYSLAGYGDLGLVDQLVLGRLLMRLIS